MRHLLRDRGAGSEPADIMTSRASRQFSFATVVPWCSRRLRLGMNALHCPAMKPERYSLPSWLISWKYLNVRKSGRLHLRKQESMPAGPDGQLGPIAVIPELFHCGAMLVALAQSCQRTCRAIPHRSARAKDTRRTDEDLHSTTADRGVTARQRARRDSYGW
jgi:hypothetical protein